MLVAFGSDAKKTDLFDKKVIKLKRIFWGVKPKYMYKDFDVMKCRSLTNFLRSRRV